jgi:hypothetical protein
MTRTSRGALRALLAAVVFLTAAPGGVRGDLVVLRSGGTVEGTARETGPSVEVETARGRRTVAAWEVERIEWKRPSAWLVRPPDWPDEVRSLGDLDVTLIEILPWKTLSDPPGPRTVDRRPAGAFPRPLPRWNPGDRITFVAHVANRGTREIRGVQYEFRLDGRLEERGSIRKILPGQRLTFPLRRRFRRGLREVSFEVDTPPSEETREISFANNRLAVSVEAPAVLVGAPREVSGSHARVRNMTGSFSFEDYVRHHVRSAARFLADAGAPAVPGLRIAGFVEAPTSRVLEERGRGPAGTDGRVLCTLFVEREMKASGTGALSLRWDLIRALLRGLGLVDPAPYLAEGRDSRGRTEFHGLLGSRTPLPLSPFSRAALTALGPVLPMGGEDILLCVPESIVLRITDSRGNPARAVRIVDPGAEGEVVWQGRCSPEGDFVLPAEGPPFVRSRAGASAPLRPFGRLVLRGGGWLEIAAETEAGEETGALELPVINLAFFRGSRTRTRVEIRTRPRKDK